jgi:hypothetical protein
MNDEISDDDFNEMDQLDVDTMLADEARDDLWVIPVHCIVYGHTFNRRGCCESCGHDRVLELALTCLARAG